MNNAKKEFLWKIETRKTAIKNTGKYQNNEPDFDQNKIRVQLYSALLDNLNEADVWKMQTGYSEIHSNRIIVGSFITFTKKVIRKMMKIFLGWYIFPIFEKQSYFNGKVVNSLSLLKDIGHQQEERQNQQEERQNQQEERQNQQEERQNQQEEIINQQEEIINQQEEIISEQSNRLAYVFNRLGVTCDLKYLKNINIDYFDFEDRFRGTRDQVKMSQMNYIDYFRTNGGRDILDIGCGRGEFLELMFDNGISVIGVDNYRPFIEYCQKRGFRVHQEDALTYLSELKDNSLGGIFMGQVVEHLPSDYVIALIEAAYRKLLPGCYFILETPNPDCLAAISEFNIDISHNKPVHYKSLEYLFKAAKFQSVIKYHTPQSKYPYEAHFIEGSNIDNIFSFNEGIQNINNLLFGFRDYTLIAKK